MGTACPKLGKPIDVSSSTNRSSCIEIAVGQDHQCSREENYRHQGVISLFRERAGWLSIFFVGLVLASFVVESFSEVLQNHYQLSFFVPLVMGHGGNTGSQSVSTVLRALALKHITVRDAGKTIMKESATGFLVGLLLGSMVLACSYLAVGLSTAVGLVVAISLPLVSLWSNGLGALLTILADHFRLDPAVTSTPLMTTIVDCTGLIVYFYIAKVMLAVDERGELASLSTTAVAGFFN